MNKKRRILAKITAAAIVIALAVPGIGMVSKASETDKASEHAAPKVKISSVGGRAPLYQVGQPQKWSFEIKNISKDPVENVTISPDLRDDADEWPFKTDYQRYTSEAVSLKSGETATVSFEFTQRDDAGSRRYPIYFSAYEGDSQEPIATQKLYANTSAKPEEANVPADNAGGNEPGGGADAGADGGGGSDVSNGDAFYSGGGSAGGSGSEVTSVPRVIVTGFSTDPAEVRAGSDFTLTIHLKNTSKKTKVQNMLFDLSAPSEGKDEQSVAPAFLPTSGSSTIYLDGIKADGTADISIQLNAKADLFQKPYSVDLSMKYEDGNGGQVDSNSSISIPVKQDARFEFSDFELNPETIEVGGEANVMCSLYNLGRIKLYNVKARFEGNGIEKEEIFIGNVESGATGSIDAMLTGKKATNGSSKVTMTLSYEDESGKVSETTKDFELEVTEALEDDMEVMDDMMEEPAKKSKLPIIIIALVVLAAAAIVFFIKRRKKKITMNEEEELLDEVDRSSEDEFK